MIMFSSVLKHNMKASPHWSSQVRIHQTGFRFYYILDIIKRSTGQNRWSNDQVYQAFTKFILYNSTTRQKKKNQNRLSLIVSWRYSCIVLFTSYMTNKGLLKYKRSIRLINYSNNEVIEYYACLKYTTWNPYILYNYLLFECKFNYFVAYKNCCCFQNNEKTKFHSFTCKKDENACGSFSTKWKYKQSITFLLLQLICESTIFMHNPLLTNWNNKDKTIRAATLFE